ncbi:shikimate kinase [Petrocella sp. FN5]|uniref:shikimate kinase n=1 Tax=Petrocella sp. FN5 TaxID=3032002 RepID=UPI0023DB34E2|nr:shikimate kinase [Petrocella sp. FN5]MDF1615865.1 shikimate kinase [Petrocella sp. FN5]
MNIILIGMSGAGKSTLGILLAKAIGKEFLDTDLLIQKKTGALLQNTINQQGIKAFLDIEEKVIMSMKVENTVIATGGSVIYSKAAMNHLKKLGRIVYLYVPFDEIENRVNNIKSRGIIMRKGRSLKDVYDERTPLYNHYCDTVVDCSLKDVEACVEAIILVIK